MNIRLFLNYSEGLTTSANHRIVLKSILMSYFITKQNKKEQNNKYCIDSEKVNLKGNL